MLLTAANSSFLRLVIFINKLMTVGHLVEPEKICRHNIQMLVFRRVKLHPRLKKLVKTRDFKSTITTIFIVTFLYGLVGWIFHYGEGKDSATNLITLANNVFKFCAWFLFGYGALQTFGRKIEFENIESATAQADLDVQCSKINSQDNSEILKVKEIQNLIYKEKIGDLDIIDKDDKTIFKLYMCGIVLFFITSFVDIVLPAFQN